MMEKRAAYNRKCDSALNYAGNAEGESWNGLYLFGLALAGLELIPWSMNITPESWWRVAPEPEGESKDWEISWIVERGTLLKESSDES